MSCNPLVCKLQDKVFTQSCQLCNQLNVNKLNTKFQQFYLIQYHLYDDANSHLQQNNREFSFIVKHKHFCRLVLHYKENNQKKIIRINPQNVFQGSGLVLISESRFESACKSSSYFLRTIKKKLTTHRFLNNILGESLSFPHAVHASPLILGISYV